MNPTHHIAGRPMISARILRGNMARSRAALAWRLRQGAGQPEEATNYISDPNTEAGFGTKVPLQASPAALPSPDSSVYSSTQVRVATPSGVNLRDQPSTTGNVLAIEQQGTLLTVIGPQQNGWLHVQDPNAVTGWVYSTYVEDASGAGGQPATPTAVAAAPSAAPSVLAGSSQASSSGLLGLALLSGAVLAAKMLL